MNKTDENTVMRQYGAAIALVSGLYSLISTISGSGMMDSISGLLMIVHSGILLTPYASRLGNTSGPLMISYSLLMLLNQALVGVINNMNWGMDDGMRTSMSGGMSSSMVINDCRNGLGPWNGRTRHLNAAQQDYYDKSARYRLWNVIGL